VYGHVGEQLGWQVKETSRLVCRHGGFNVQRVGGEVANVRLRSCSPAGRDPCPHA
jgi:hypothetical protein